MGLTVGIDLGRTNCRMAHWKASGKAGVLMNRDNVDVLSARLAVNPEGSVLLGRAALAAAASHPDWVVGDLDGALETGTLRVVGETAWPPERILSHLLRRLKGDAELRCGEAVTAAVVAHPTGWSERAQARLCEAGALADLVVTPLASAAAAAIGAGIYESKPTHVLVYDLGAADFSAALLTWDAERLQLLSTVTLGDAGGAAFDQQIIDYVTALAQRQQKGDPLTNQKFMAELRAQAVDAKITLGTSRSADLVLVGLLSSGALDIDLAIEREEFERLIEPLVRRTLEACLQLVEAAGWKVEEIGRVVTAGASTEVPLVRAWLGDTFGAEKLVRGDAVSRIALGAAIQTGPMAVTVERAVAAAPPPPAPPAEPPSPVGEVPEDEIPTTPEACAPEAADATPPQESLPPEEPAGAPEQETPEEPEEEVGVMSPQPTVPLDEARVAQAAAENEAAAAESGPAQEAIRLTCRQVEVKSSHYEFGGTARVFVQGPNYHLSCPAFSEGPVLDRTRIYLAEPIPESLTVLLSTEGGETFATALPLPAGVAVGEAVELKFAVDLESHVPYVEAALPAAGARAAATIVSSEWRVWAPPVPEPAPEPVVSGPIVPEPVPQVVEARAEVAKESEAPAPAVAAAEKTEAYGNFEPLELLESTAALRRFRARSLDMGEPALLNLYAAADERSRTAFLSSLLPLHIDHPNVLRVLDFGRRTGDYFVVTEMAGSDALRSLMGNGRERRPVEVAVVSPLALQILSGIQALHQHHIFHRNLKPGTILLNQDRTSAKIGEFQIAVSLRPGDSVSQVSGTLPYMSKDVLEGRGDHRADLYAMGVILFELLTGRLPFWADSQRQLVDHITGKEAPEPRSLNPEIPQRWNEAILRALDKDPARRFQTAEEFSRALSSEEEPAERLMETITSQPVAGAAIR